MAIFQSSILAVIKEHLFVTIFETIFGLFKASNLSEFDGDSEVGHRITGSLGLNMIFESI